MSADTSLNPNLELVVKSVNLSKQHDEKLHSVCKNSDSNKSFSNEQRQNVMPADKTDFSITIELSVLLIENRNCLHWRQILTFPSYVLISICPLVLCTIPIWVSCGELGIWINLNTQRSNYENIVLYLREWWRSYLARLIKKGLNW